MARLENQIIQTTLWKDGDKLKRPLSNYKNAYPITVYDAVHEEFEVTSESLRERLEKIDVALGNRQTIIPAKDPNNIITYGGTIGAIGSIKISHRIPSNNEEVSNEKIPTERAIWNFIQIMNGNTNNTPVEEIISWDNIIDKPNIVNELGYNENAIISQNGMTNILRELQENLVSNLSDSLDNIIPTPLLEHITDNNNPHGITIDKIGAVSRQDYRNHVSDYHNPHRVTPDDLGLGNVNNTSDLDKPISNAVRTELDRLNITINALSGNVGDMRFVTNVRFLQNTKKLAFTYSDGDISEIPIQIDGLIDEVTFDNRTQTLVVTELSGREIRVPLLLDENNNAITANSDTIIIEHRDGETYATIKPHSITNTELKNGVNGGFIENNTLSGIKIADNSIGSSKYANRSIGSEKLIPNTLTSNQIKNGSISPISLSVPESEYQLLGFINDEPEWVHLHNDMIPDDEINGNKLKDGTVYGTKIVDQTITTSKLVPGIIHHEYIYPGSIESDSFNSVIELPSNTSINVSEESENNIVNISWVNNRIRNLDINGSQIESRGVDGRALFSSPIKNRVLVVDEVNGDPKWDKVTNPMMDDDSVYTNNIVNESITADKLAENSVYSNALQNDSVTNRSILDHTINPIKLIDSEYPNRVIGVGDEVDNPRYLQVTSDMIADEVIRTSHIIDRNITPSKLSIPTDPNYAIMTYDFHNQEASWGMIRDEFVTIDSISPNKLTHADRSNVVLAVLEQNTTPVYTKITADMLDDETILQSFHIADNAISNNHLKDNSVTRRNIVSNSIGTDEIENNTITVDKLKHPGVVGKVIQIPNEENAVPEWKSITGELIEKNSVPLVKLETSEDPFMVVGVDNLVGDNPKYVRLTEDFFDDKAIGSSKLAWDLVLYGNTRIGNRPSSDSNDDRVPDTKWVRNTIDSTIASIFSSTHEDININLIDAIPDGSITEFKLSDNSVTERTIRDQSVTTDKIADYSVTTRKLADNSIDHTKLVNNLKLPNNTEATTDNLLLDKPRVRNIIISHKDPSDGNTGDIWLRYY